jgi:flagellar export protein FliJ
MSRFQFRLDSLLRIREALARQEEARLAALVAQRTLLENNRAEINDRKLQLAMEQQRVAAAGTDGVELHFAQHQGLALESCIRELEWKLQRLEPEIRAQQQRYGEARRELEKLDRLHSNALEAWTREATRHEQQTNDELFLMRSIPGKQRKL